MLVKSLENAYKRGREERRHWKQKQIFQTKSLRCNYISFFLFWRQALVELCSATVNSLLPGGVKKTWQRNVFLL